MSIEKSGTGNIERTGTGAIERTGTGAIERTGTGSIERTGTGAIERTGTGRIAWMAAAILFASSLFATSAMAREMHQIGSLMITTVDSTATVSWHVKNDSGMSVLTGQADIASGFALVDLYDATSWGAKQTPWGQLELNVLKDGSVSGTILNFESVEAFQFRSSDTANYLIQENEFLKIAGGGTGAGGGGNNSGD